MKLDLHVGNRFNSVLKVRFLWLIVMIFFIGLHQACIKEDIFGLSSFNEITSFQLPGQAGLTTINREDRSISIAMPTQVDLSSLIPSEISISNLATISPEPSEPQNFLQPVIYTVKAENGTEAIWTVTVVSAQPNPQLPNSNFDSWYAVSDYFQPGENA